MHSNLASALGFGLQVPVTKKMLFYFLYQEDIYIYLEDLTGKRSEPS